eukprot:TRINITY_DN17990_c0_g1_i2.p1 TRINITY_DN17990_c0_g1~~TRINITY_DN17990_c0_g1_i2.p1  ORF type:complete len:493 (-),score=59.14 TRINITY_DN17990_c0_g1_i2:55-1533(-)
MVYHSSLDKLKARLRDLGETPEFVVRGKGHLQFRCKLFRGACVNFWPSKCSWNVQGGDKDFAELLNEPYATSTQRPRVPEHPVVQADIGMTSQDKTKIVTLTHERACVEPKVLTPDASVRYNGEIPNANASNAVATIDNMPSSDTKNTSDEACKLADRVKSADHLPRCEGDDRQPQIPDPPQAIQESVEAAEVALDERIGAIISKSFARWRGEQRRVMRDTYQAFCVKREQECRAHFEKWCSGFQNGSFPQGLELSLKEWLSSERRALEQSYAHWEQEETQALGDAIGSWRVERRRLMAAERDSLLMQLKAESRRELNTWKDQERASLIADIERSVAVSDGEEKALRDDLCNAMQLLRSVNASKAEAVQEQARLRQVAEAAEAALKSERDLVDTRALKRRVFQSTRGERLAKRVRIEHDPRLQGLSGDLFTKIKQAEEKGLLSRAEASKFHQIRMQGNRAAHEPQGCFGTQIGPADCDRSDTVLVLTINHAD